MKQTGVVAGTVLLVELPPEQNAGRVAHRGRLALPPGLVGPRATPPRRPAALLRKGFADGLSEIYAVVRPENEPSLKVCRRLGMTHLGQTSRWYDAVLEQFRLTAPAGDPAYENVSMRDVVLLGSTGSIGTQAIDIVRAQPGPVPGGRRSAPAAATSSCSPPRRSSSASRWSAVAKASAAQDLQLAFYAEAPQRGYATGEFRHPEDPGRAARR